MLIDRGNVVETFRNYVNNYNQEDQRIKLKVDHTYRVAMLCERIAIALKFTKEDVELAWLIGMLHDIGRFEQLTNYDTFNDAKSINHAQYGVNILFNKEVIRGYINNNCYDELIRDAIWYHNVYVLPDNLDERTKLFCNLIRDADKIDILKVNAEIPLHTIYDFSEEQIKQAIVTKEVMDSYFKHEAVNHKLKKSPIDHTIGHVSLVFELVFSISLKIVEEQGYLRKIFEFKSENEVTMQQLRLLEQDMKEYFLGV